MFSVVLSDMKTFDLAVECRNRDLVEYLKPYALSLACRQGNVNGVKSVINEFNCDPKGLCVMFCCQCVYLLNGVVMYT